MNPWKVFQSIIPNPPLQVAQVVSHDGADRSLVELPTGETMLVFGQDVAAGGWCYIKAGRIQGAAPTLPVVEVSV